MTNGSNAVAIDKGLMEALNQYKDNISIYPTKANGGYGIAFYYEDIYGKKDRKVFCSKNKEILMNKRTEFLTNLYYEKQAMSENTKQIETKIVTSMPHVSYKQENHVCPVTIEQAVDKFLEYYKPTVSHQTYLGEVTCSNHIKRLLGTRHVSEITFEDFQTLVNNLSKRSVNGKTVIAAEKSIRNIIISFKRIMRYCSRNKWISVEDLMLIISDIKIPTFITDSDHDELVKASKFLDYKQTGEVLRLLGNNRRYYLVIRILYLTGLRPQEFFALEKTDLYPEQDYIDIRQALVVQEKATDNDRYYDIGTTKNKGSRRKVPAIPEVFKYFDELEKLMIESGLRKKSMKKGNGNMVIVDKNGDIVNVHYFGVNLVKCIKENSPNKIVKTKLTLNMPRHCYQDYLDELGAKDTDVEKAVGHVIDKTNERFYKTQPIYINRLRPYLETMALEIEKALNTV